MRPSASEPLIADQSAIDASADERELLRVDRLGFRYPDGTQALRDFSFTVPARTNVSVIGPSGCGKSTLLHLLAGLAPPSSGEIRWNRTKGFDSHYLSMVFQKDTLLPWLTVEKNVALYSRFRRTDRHVVRARVDELLGLAHLEGARKKYPYQLSGGMRRRVQFLAAVAPSPKVLLLDEPFSSLDEPTRIGLHQDVFDISRALDMSLVVVTHDLAEAISLSDEVLVLTDRPARVIERHRVPFGLSRDVQALREDDRFLKLYGTLWHELGDQIRMQQTRGRPS